MNGLNAFEVKINIMIQGSVLPGRINEWIFFFSSLKLKNINFVWWLPTIPVSLYIYSFHLIKRLSRSSQLNGLHQNNIFALRHWFSLFNWMYDLYLYTLCSFTKNPSSVQLMSCLLQKGDDIGPWKELSGKKTTTTKMYLSSKWITVQRTVYVCMHNVTEIKKSINWLFLFSHIVDDVAAAEI